MSNYVPGESINVGGVMYKFLYKCEMKTGLVKEYYKCVTCKGRLQVYVDLGTFEITTPHVGQECFDLHKKFVAEFKNQNDRSMFMESILFDSTTTINETLDPSVLSDTFVISFLDTTSGDGSNLENTVSEDSQLSQLEPGSEESMVNSSVSISALEDAFLDDTFPSFNSPSADTNIQVCSAVRVNSSDSSEDSFVLEPTKNRQPTRLSVSGPKQGPSRPSTPSASKTGPKPCHHLGRSAAIEKNEDVTTTSRTTKVRFAVTDNNKPIEPSNNNETPELTRDQGLRYFD